LADKPIEDRGCNLKGVREAFVQREDESITGYKCEIDRWILDGITEGFDHGLW
jgi:hypothetical protein